MDYDLLVIGGGTAGLNAAKAAHSLGAKQYVFPTLGGALFDTMAS